MIIFLNLKKLQKKIIMICNKNLCLAEIITFLSERKSQHKN